MAEKKYVGKGKLGKFENIEIGLRHDQLVPNDRGYVNLVVAQMREPDKWGNTHTVYVNEYAGRGSGDSRTTTQQPDVAAPSSDKEGGEWPF